MRRLLITLALLGALAGLVVLFVFLAMPPPQSELRETVAPPKSIAAPEEEPQRALREQGTIKGKVVFGPTGEPMPNATVIALAPYLDPGDAENLPMWGEMAEKARVKTGPDGTFEIADLPPDYWNIWAEKPGYGFTTIPRAKFGGEHVIKLWPGASVRGKVVFDDGSPAPGIRIEYTPQGTHSEVFSRYRLKSYYTQTRKDGTFEYTDLPPGKFTVEVYSDNHLPAPWTVEPPLKHGDRRDLGIRKLDTGFGMTVRVVWIGSNEPVSDVEVKVEPLGDPMPRTSIGQSRRTNAQGIARFQGLGGQVMPKPIFQVAAQVGGETIMPDMDGPYAPDQDLTIYVRRRCTIIGRVVDGRGEPLPRYFLELRAKEHKTYPLQQWVSKPDRGKFKMSGIPEGDYAMTIRFPGLTDKTFDVTAVAARETDIGTIVLEEGAEIWGEVRLASGGEIKDVMRVVLSRKIKRGKTKMDSYEPISRTVVKSDGSYRLRGLPTGTFWLQPLSVVNLSTTEPEQVTITGPTQVLQKDLIVYGSGFVDFSYWDTVEGSRRQIVPVPTFLTRTADGKAERWYGNGSRFRPGTYDVEFEMKNEEGVPTRYKGPRITIQEDQTTGPIEVSLPDIRDAERQEELPPSDR